MALRNRRLLVTLLVSSSLVVLLAGLGALPTPALAQAAYNKAKALSSITQTLTKGKTLYDKRSWADAISTYKDAMTQIQAAEKQPEFTDQEQQTLKQNEFEALLRTGMGKMRAVIHSRSNRPTNDPSDPPDDDPYICSWISECGDFGGGGTGTCSGINAEFAQSEIDDFFPILQNARQIAETFNDPIPDEEWVYMSMAWADCWSAGGMAKFDETQSLLSKAAELFKLRNNTNLYSTALNLRAQYLYNWLESPDFQEHTPQTDIDGHTGGFWWKEMSNSARDSVLTAPVELTSTWPLNSPGNWASAPGLVYTVGSLDYSLAVENGYWQDADFDLNQSLREQIRIADFLASGGGSGYVESNSTAIMYQGIARERLAWLTHDIGLAAEAVTKFESDFNYANMVSGKLQMTFGDSLPLAHFMGLAYSQVGNRPDLALFFLNAADAVAPAAGYGSDHYWYGRQIQFINDWYIGRNLTILGRYHDATQRYEILEKRPNFATNPLFPDVMVDLSTLYQRLNQYEQSITPLQNRVSYYQQAAKNASANTDPQTLQQYQSGIIDSLLRLSTPLAILGRTEEALTGLQNAVDQAAQLNKPDLLVDTLLRVGDIYLQLQSQDNALTSYAKAADLAKTDHLFQQQGQALLGEGQIQVQRNLLKDAAATLAQANQVAQSAHDTESQVTSLIALGDLALKGDKPDAAGADKSYRKALSLADKTNISLSIASLLPLGDLQAQKDGQAATITYYRALVDALKINDPESIAKLYGRIGQIRATANQDVDADLAFANAIKVVEQAQRGFKSENLTSQFASNYAWIYADYIQLLFKEKRYEEAFAIAERGRARAFLDQLAIGPVDLRQGADANLLQQDTDLRQQIEAVQDLLTQAQSATPPDKDYIASLKKTLQVAENDYTVLFTRIQAQNPTLATLTGVETASIKDVQAALPAETSLISYYTTDTQTYVFILTKDAFSAQALEIPQSTLQNAVQSFRADEKQQTGLADLYKLLVSPIASQITTSRLIIVPHSYLNYLPFAALPTDAGKPLGEQFSISYLPSATTLLHLPLKPQQTGSLLAFGNPTVEGLPPLPFAETEVKQVAALSGGQALIGKDAKESVIFSQGGQAGILYIAAHGIFNPRDPLFSTLYLTPGDGETGNLEAYRIYGLDLTKSTELVVLSACETAVGSLSAGDELSALNRAFLYAGSPSVIASLWAVDDQATDLLMESFIKARTQGMSNADALQAAENYVRTYTDKDGTTPYSSPYYWAAFVLTGR